jgi:hypothetical protein
MYLKLKEAGSTKFLAKFWWRWPLEINSPKSLKFFSKGSQNSHRPLFSRQAQTSGDRFETFRVLLFSV